MARLIVSPQANADLIAIADWIMRDNPPAAERWVDAMMPKDQAFLTVNAMASLEVLDPKRNSRKRSLDAHISRVGGNESCDQSANQRTICLRRT